MQPVITLPRDAYHHLIHTLRDLMPPISGTQEDLVRRDHAAIAQVAALCPANAAQAALAAQYVAANAHAMQCLRETRAPGATAEDSRRNTAQAASMMRQSQGALRLLLRAQGVHPGRKPDDEAAEGAAWTEYCAEQWMMQALRDGAVESEKPIDCPTIQRHEMESDTLADPVHMASETTPPPTADHHESQNLLHAPTTHIRETDSGSPGHQPDCQTDDAGATTRASPQIQDMIPLTVTMRRNPPPSPPASYPGMMSTHPESPHAAHHQARRRRPRHRSPA